VTGHMIFAEWSAAFRLYANLGSAYLSVHMPPWLRRRLGAGCLTVLCKKAMVPGEVPNARPAKAEDFDCSAWTKAAQQLHTPGHRDAAAVRRRRKRWGRGLSVGPQALVRKKYGAWQPSWGRGSRHPLDISNAHNTFDREASIKALSSFAGADGGLRSLPLA
jgi:hypothetical protein